MKLTKYHRQAFVRAVMNDVPKEDYESKAHAIAIEDSILQLPEKLQAAARDKDLSRYISRANFWSREFSSVLTFAIYAGDFKLSAKAQVEFDKLSELAKTQSSARYALKQKLESAIGARTTDMQVRKALPEFSKYLPAAESPVDRTVPVIANLVADLTKMGWPKDKAEGQLLAA